MERQISLADNSTATVRIGDQIKLKDGRVLTISEFASFGKIKAVAADGSMAFVNPSDIIQIIQNVVETVEKAKSFWAWFAKTQLGRIVVTAISKIFKRKNGN